jgi:hypothetical protein
MLVGLSVHVNPAGETDGVRAIVPVNPSTGATVTVEVADAPASAVTAVGVALTVKFDTVYVTIALCVRPPPVPVTVTVYVPAVVEEQDSTDAWLAPRIILVGVRVQVRPDGETKEVSATVPVKPCTGATVMVDGPETPDATFTVKGLADTVKSGVGTVTVTVAV